MKIYILPVHEALQPNWARVIFPAHHVKDYGAEQDFLTYLYQNPDLLTTNPQQADFHYLPAFWSRWNINYYNHQQTAPLFLQILVDDAILDDSKTFTVCCLSLETKADLGKTLVFWASRNSQTAIDIPIVCNPHDLPAKLPEKKYLASFVGSYKTHPMRKLVAECFANQGPEYLIDESKEVSFFIEKVLESYITLCPRGAGGSSFRFFETMQLGGVPLLIGDLDTRPFKKYINWEHYSFYAETPQEALKIVQSCGKDKDKLLKMGKQCAKLWKSDLTYGKWCRFVVKTLDDLKKQR